MLLATAVCTLIAVLALDARNAGAENARYTGSWRIDTLPDKHMIDLGMTYRSRGSTREDSNTVAFVPSSYPGLSADEMEADNASVRFKIVRDAGDFDCEGYFMRGTGSGVFTFVPSSGYAAAFESRGFGRPSADEQFRLAQADVSLAMIDRMRSLGVKGLSASSLVRLADHDVSGAYVQGLSDAGVNARSVEELVRLRDHDVNVDFVAGLGRLGYHPGIEDLVRLRDHDVDLNFIAKLRSHGYNPSIEDLIRLRDSGM